MPCRTEVSDLRYNGPVSDARSSLTVDEVGSAASDATVLAVAGELDLATIGTLREAVAGHLAPGARVVLDLAGLTFCDSTGLGGFVALHRQARSSGARLAFAGPRKRISDLFTLSGIDQVIAVFDTPDAAVAGTADSADTVDSASDSASTAG
jgi:anti-sigma B factor antagonist